LEQRSEFCSAIAAPTVSHAQIENIRYMRTESIIGPLPLSGREQKGWYLLKQLSEVRLLHPLMLRQALNLVQHPCVHPVISALGSDTIAALHAELQDWKSSLQTRTLWLPALQGDLAGLID
jgi:hypothetical protein